MKVLLTADTVGGVFTYALELARALAGRGVEVALATEGRALSPDQRRAIAALPPLVRSFESDFRLEWMEEPWEDVAAASRWLLELEELVRPDVIHLSQYAHASAGFRAPVLVVGHSCVLSWYEAVRRSAAPASWDRYRAEVRRGLTSAARVVTPSRAMAAALDRHYGPLPPVQVVPNGRDPALFPPGPKEDLILAAGRIWDEAKNLGSVAEAAPDLRWPVCLAGEARAPEGSVSGAAPARLLSNVHWLGSLAPDVLARWYRRAAIYALPARYEPFGLSVLEAALAGCALVLGDIPSLRERWDGAAVFVDPEDPAALRRALVGLIAAPDLRRTLSNEARERALDLGLDRMATAYLAIYRGLGRAPGLEEARPCGS